MQTHAVMRPLTQLFSIGSFTDSMEEYKQDMHAWLQQHFDEVAKSKEYFQAGKKMLQKFQRLSLSQKITWMHMPDVSHVQLRYIGWMGMWNG